MTISSGTRLGPYEIVESIGAGGMGEVWRACCGSAWRSNEAFFKGDTGQIIAVTVEPVNVSMPEVLFLNPRIDTFDVSPVGQRILANITPEIDKQPLTMISNWTAMIERER